MEAIKRETRLEAWMDAVELLLERGPMLNLVLSIESPGSDGPSGVAALRHIDKFHRAEGKDPTHTVAETIFPGWQYRRRGLQGVFELSDPLIRENSPAHRRCRR